MDARPTESDISSSQTEKAFFSDSVSISELIEQLTGFVRRQLPIFVFVTAISLAVGLLYLFTAPAFFTARAIMVIDSSKMRVLQQQQSTIGDVPLDMAQVETQVEILKSDTIGLSVVKELRLIDDPEFIDPKGNIFNVGRQLFFSLFSLFETSEQASEDVLTKRALGVYKTNRAVARVGRTYVLEISYSAMSPSRAAGVANAIVDSYITDQLESKYQATRRASSWLQDRIAELRKQASAADSAVLDYKEKNNIIDVGGSTALGGTGSRLLGEQTLSELNSQLGSARNLTAESFAKLQRIKEVMKQDLPDAAVADSLKNEVINRLRNQYLDLSTRAAIWTARYGATHIATINLRTQMTEIRRSIANELGRIAESYESDFEIAKSRQESLEQTLSRSVSTAQETNRDRLGLRELESTAQVYHTIYDNFLQRYMEAIQQQSFPITEARLISAATPPSGKSSPRTYFVLLITGAIGLAIAFAAATFREAVDRVFRTTRQVEQLLHSNCLAVLPLLKASVGKQPLNWNQGQQELLRSSSLRKKIILPRAAFLRYVVDEPLSSFAEAFRSIKVAADIAGAIKVNKVIGVTSTIPREGKSTVSSNLAELIAHAGKRVILVDGDLRNPTLTRNLAHGATSGLLQVLGQESQLEEQLYTDDTTNLKFLPAVVESRLAHSNEILASVAFKTLIEQLRKSFDYVIVDLPPLAPVVDVRATSNIIDSYVYVVGWGETRMNVVQHQLASAPEIFERLLGVVLNKANISVLERYEYYYGKYYYKKYYSQYGYTS